MVHTCLKMLGHAQSPCHPSMAGRPWGGQQTSDEGFCQRQSLTWRSPASWELAEMSAARRLSASPSTTWLPGSLPAPKALPTMRSATLATGCTQARLGLRVQGLGSRAKPFCQAHLQPQLGRAL